VAGGWLQLWRPESPRPCGLGATEPPPRGIRPSVFLPAGRHRRYGQRRPRALPAPIPVLPGGGGGAWRHPLVAAHRPTRHPPGWSTAPHRARQAYLSGWRPRPSSRLVPCSRRSFRPGIARWGMQASAKGQEGGFNRTALLRPQKGLFAVRFRLPPDRPHHPRRWHGNTSSRLRGRLTALRTRSIKVNGGLPAHDHAAPATALPLARRALLPTARWLLCGGCGASSYRITIPCDGSFPGIGRVVRGVSGGPAHLHVHQQPYSDEIGDQGAPTV
jgi:hypothetical protein